MGKGGRIQVVGNPVKKARVEKSITKSDVKSPHTSILKPKFVVTKEPIVAGSKSKGEEKGKGSSTTLKLTPPPMPPKQNKSKSEIKAGVHSALNPRSLPSTFKIIAGSYEKLLYGLEGTVTLNGVSSPQFHLKPIFIFPAHVSCIKSVAASPGGGKWLATGSTDEIVKVWDLRRKKEVGGLMHHQGSCVLTRFYSHM